MSGKKRISLSPVLKQHKFIFDLMKNTTSDFTFMMDPAADIFLAAPAFVQTYGLPAETLVHVADVLEPLVYIQDRKPLEALFSSLDHLTEGRDRQLDFRMRDAKGDFSWLRLKGRLGFAGDVARRTFSSGRSASLRGAARQIL